MLTIDTNIVVRYLTDDHPKQSPRARALVDGQPVLVSLTVMHEVELVLRSSYGFRRAVVPRVMRSFAGLPTVKVEDGAVAATALDLAESGVDFTDAPPLGMASHCEDMASSSTSSCAPQRWQATAPSGRL